VVLLVGLFSADAPTSAIGGQRHTAFRRNPFKICSTITLERG